MGRMIILILCAVISMQTRGQSLQIYIGKDVKIVAEYENTYKRLYHYAYIENSREYGCFTQLIVEGPVYRFISAHVEFRTDMHNQIYITGIGFSKEHKYGMISLQPLYRHDTESNFQLSFVHNMQYKRLALNGYIDAWNMNNLSLYSQTRVYLRIIKAISIGMMLEVEYFNKLNLNPYFGLKLDLK